MSKIEIPGKWSFIIGEPDDETPLAKKPKGTLEVSPIKINAYKDGETELAINTKDVKKVYKETKRGTLMVKVMGRYKQIYTFIPLAGGDLDKNALAGVFIEAVKKVLPPPPAPPP